MQYQGSGDHYTPKQFLLFCLRSTWDPAALEPAFIQLVDHVDWNHFSELVRGQRVGPLVYKALSDYRLMPPELELSLRHEFLRNAMRNSLLLDELGVVTGKLQIGGVNAMPLKGAALVKTIYKSPAVRPMADLDLLISPADLYPTLAILTNLNYSIMDIEPWPGYSKRFRQVLEFSRRSDDGFTFLIDIHWGIVDIPYYKRIPVDAWFERAEVAHGSGQELKAPAPEDHLVCLFSHWALHERYNDDLLRYCDLAMLIACTGTNLKWERLIQEAQEWQLVVPFLRSIKRLEELWPDTVPAPVLQEIIQLEPTPNERRIHRWVIDRPQNATSDVLLFAVTTPGLVNKVLLLLEQAFPSPAYMRDRYNRKRSRLWPLLYLWRFFLGFCYTIKNGKLLRLLS